MCSVCQMESLAAGPSSGIESSDSRPSVSSSSGPAAGNCFRSKTEVPRSPANKSTFELFRY